MITIVGAGLAGLLAANMLRRHAPSILEAQSSLPNNHHAVLRFRTEEVSRQLHIPFKRVRVFKSCDECDPIKAAMLYSKKVTGRYELRSLIDLSPVDRFIAPPDLISQMAEGLYLPPAYDCAWRPGDHEADVPVISTMPMAALMDTLGYGGERPAFVSHPGWVIRATIDQCEVYATRYYARHRGLIYRASITGNNVIIEGVGDDPWDVPPNDTLARILMDFGIVDPTIIEGPKVHRMRYSKIGELSAADRAKAKQFMFWATREHNVYSLGRFATWRAGLLLDDLVKDIITIERWISQDAPHYDIRKEMSK